MPTIPANDPRIRWPGAIHVTHTEAGSTPLRLDPAEDALFDAGLREKLHCPAGVRMRFATAASRILGRTSEDHDCHPIACTVDGEIVAARGTDGGDTFVLEELPAGDKVVELWLPQGKPDWTLVELELDADIAAPPADERPKWIHYGSSISHCGAAETPAETWPAVAARRGGFDLTCFGVGGQCHLDPMVARMIRDRAADAISLKVGINIMGRGSLNDRTYGPGIVGFVKLLRERHATIPIAVVSPIFCPHRESQPNQVGMTLQLMREQAEAAVAALRSCGDEHVHYLSGLELFDAPDAEAGHLPDDLHPDHEGYRLMGERFHAAAMQRWFV